MLTYYWPEASLIPRLSVGEGKGELGVHMHLINPRRAHALARVTVVGLCVYLSVCLSVCVSVRTKSASTRI